MAKLYLGGELISGGEDVRLELKVVNNKLWCRHNGIPDGCELVVMYRRKYKKQESSDYPDVSIKKKWSIIYGGSENIKEGSNYTFTKGVPNEWYVPELCIGGEEIGERIELPDFVIDYGPKYLINALNLEYCADDEEGNEMCEIIGGYRHRATRQRNIHLKYALAIVKHGGTGPNDRNQILAFNRFNVNIVWCDTNFVSTLTV